MATVTNSTIPRDDAGRRPAVQLSLTFGERQDPGTDDISFALPTITSAELERRRPSWPSRPRARGGRS